jgi:hypothetical protein
MPKLGRFTSNPAPTDLAGSPDATKVGLWMYYSLLYICIICIIMFLSFRTSQRTDRMKSQKNQDFIHNPRLRIK